MKINISPDHFLIKKDDFKYPFKTMKICLLFLFAFTFQMMAFNSHAQDAVIELERSTITIGQLISEIENQTDYLVVYSNREVDTNRKVNFQQRSDKVSSFLNTAFSSTDIGYNFENDYIVLSKKAHQNAITIARLIQTAQQQGRTITGKVTDENGEPVIGATIVVKDNSSHGTITDIYGIFNLTNLRDNAILQITYVGMQPQEINTTGLSTVNVILESDTELLEEIVVVGYGTQKKVNLTGAIGVASGEALENRPMSNVTQGLQGLIPNLNVSFSDGQPNTAANINIRGLTSLNGGSALILVDGVETSDLSLINPQDIDNISVLKDAASSAIYGARAAFGVVLVTTKSGRLNEKVKVNYSNNLSWSNITRLPDAVSSDKWIRAVNEANVNNGNGKYFSDEQVAAIDAYIADPINNPSAFLDETGAFTAKGQWGYAGNTDWFSEVYQKAAFMQQHNVNISGGTNKNTFYGSLGLKDQEGLFKQGNDEYKRFNLAFNFNSEITKWLDLGFKVKYNKSKSNLPNTFYMGSIYHEVYRAFPHIPMYLPDGNFAGIEGANFNYNIAGMMALAGRTTDRIDDLWFTGTFNLKPTKNLSIKGDFTQSLYYVQNKEHRKTIYQTMPDPNAVPLAKGNPNGVNQSKRFNNYQAFNIWADYQKSFGDHNLNMLVGYNQEQKVYSYLRSSATGLFDNNFPVSDLAQTFQSLEETATIWAVQGGFFRINYDYNSKYLIEINGRYDGSSKYPSDKRWGFFPSVSAGWRISEEKFYEPIKPAIEYLKFRVSTGSLGNQVTDGNFQYLGTLGSSSLSYIIDSKRLTSLNPPSLASTNITWEKVQSNNIGVDLSTLNNRLSASFDYYIRDTKGMVESKAFPAVLGVTGGKENLADMRVKGWELSLTWNDRINNVGGSPLRYSITIGLSDYLAEITKYDNPTEILTSHYEGKKMGEIWGYVTDGFINDDDEAIRMGDIQSFISRTWIPGDIRFKDLDGDGKINQGENTVSNPGDRKIIGNSTPRYSFTITPSLSWKNFGVRLLFQGVGKRDIAMDSGKNVFWGYNSSLWQMSLADYHIDNSWREDNKDAYYPVPLRNARSKQVQTKYLQNAAYIRLKDLTVSYTFPKQLISKIKIEQLRIYASGQNLWEATKFFKYLDPDAMGRTNTAGLVDADGKIYPFTRVYSLGVNLSF
jgi:TonB-linked SusC/RagA family outer membrane protein